MEALLHPFPHVVLYDVLDAETISNVLAEVHPPEAASWSGGSEGEGEGRVGRRKVWMGASRYDSAVFKTMNWASLQLSALVEMDSIVMLDTSYAGVFQMRHGQMLSPHSDKTETLSPDWIRRWSAVVFLNECEGGHLELEDPDDGVAWYAPEPGKLVAWEMSPCSYHGVSPVWSDRRLTLAFHLATPRQEGEEPTTAMRWMVDHDA